MKLFKQKWFKVTIVVITILLILPTVTLGGTFIVSLISGKTVEEAVQILAEQIDSLIGRVEVLESQQKKEEACRKAEELKIAPQETKIAYYSEKDNRPIYASWAPDTTEALLEYLN